MTATDGRAQEVLRALERATRVFNYEAGDVEFIQRHTWDLSDAVIRRRLAQLEQAGIVERVGERPRRWRIIQ
jgi:DNA-binding HxlR family transcriptional regulator